MADVVVAAAVLLGIPLAVFIALNWRQEQRERERRRQYPRAEDPPRPSRDSYWGGMGRPGR